MRRRVTVLFALVVLLAGAAAMALTGRSISPLSRDGVVWNKLFIAVDAGRAPLNLTVHTTDPTNVVDGDMYIVDDGASRQQICMRSGSSFYCVDATLTP